MNSRNDLLSFITADPRLARLHTGMRERVAGDPGHDLGHLERVALLTVRIAGSTVNAAECIAAALLHDIVNLPKDSPDRSKASEQSAALALTWLEGFQPEAVERIRTAIRDHSYSRGVVPATPLGRALQDADRLEALGAIGVMRCISCGTRMGAAFFHPGDPWSRGRELDDRAWSVDHFFMKLLDLEKTMCTDTGRREAQRRTEFLRGFLRQLGDELGEPPPS